MRHPSHIHVQRTISRSAPWSVLSYRSRLFCLVLFVFLFKWLVERAHHTHCFLSIPLLKMTHLLFVFFIVGLLPFLVSAHGYIGSVTIDGQSYPGNEPGGATNPSIIRQVSPTSHSNYFVFDILRRVGINDQPRQRRD